MFTPQQIDQISFGKATFGGYDMQDVDEFLEPLTEDYVTLYKENALLKSKMRVLVGKLEEYRKNEASMKDAIVNAQKTCDKMVRDAEVKAAQMLSSALCMRKLLSMMHNLGYADLNYVKLKFIIRIMQELQICEITEPVPDTYLFEFHYQSTKTNIEKSSILRKLKTQLRKS